MKELRAALCRSLRQAPLPPFQPETSVVSSQDMERWLAMRMTQASGVAKAYFPSRRALVERVSDLGTPESVDPAATCSGESLCGALLGLVAELLSEPALAPAGASRPGAGRALLGGRR
ncbi:MAG: exodeoxyribonuclease V subunit gamma [Polyangiaceae bacterium]|nr:exodeoxyribonuclease V subunit gamma [Polyangiaceae bacterium]MCL4750208.1 exodeoxyribonuclease V subunit gamma [Myxococcales bacterium]